MAALVPWPDLIIGDPVAIANRVGITGPYDICLGQHPRKYCKCHVFVEYVVSIAHLRHL